MFLWVNLAPSLTVTVISMGFLEICAQLMALVLVLVTSMVTDSVASDH